MSPTMQHHPAHMRAIAPGPRCANVRSPHLHGEACQQVVPGPLAERLDLHVPRTLVALTRPMPDRVLLDVA